MHWFDEDGLFMTSCKEEKQNRKDSCNFCKEIYESAHDIKGNWGIAKGYPRELDIDCCIGGLWYNGIKLQNVKYCPYCGRELSINGYCDIDSL